MSATVFYTSGLEVEVATLFLLTAEQWDQMITTSQFSLKKIKPIKQFKFCFYTLIANPVGSFT